MKRSLGAGLLFAGLLSCGLPDVADAVTLKPGDIIVGNDAPEISFVDPQTRVRTSICQCTTFNTIWDVAVKGTDKIYAVGQLPNASEAVVEINPADGQQRVVSSGGNFIR